MVKNLRCRSIKKFEKGEWQGRIAHHLFKYEAMPPFRTSWLYSNPFQSAKAKVTINYFCKYTTIYFVCQDLFCYFTKTRDSLAEILYAH